MIDCIWWDECPLSSRYRGLRYCHERCSWYAQEMDPAIVSRRVRMLASVRLNKLTSSDDNGIIAKSEVQDETVQNEL